MIPKELLEDLIRAGFPFEMDLSPESDHTQMVWRSKLDKEALLKACGDKLDRTEFKYQKWAAIGKNYVEGIKLNFETMQPNDVRRVCVGFGNTEEEALANFWLALNRKK